MLPASTERDCEQITQTKLVKKITHTKWLRHNQRLAFAFIFRQHYFSFLEPCHKAFRSSPSFYSPSPIMLPEFRPPAVVNPSVYPFRFSAFFFPFFCLISVVGLSLFCRTYLLPSPNLRLVFVNLILGFRLPHVQFSSISRSVFINLTHNFRLFYTQFFTLFCPVFPFSP